MSGTELEIKSDCDVCELTREDIQAIRKSTEVHARRSVKSELSDRFSASQLECYRRVDRDGGVWENSHGEQRRNVRCAETVRSYDKTVKLPWGVNSGDGLDVTCWSYGVGGDGDYQSHWRTIVGMLRVGDVIELEWIAGSLSGGYLDDAHGTYGDNNEFSYTGLHGDELRLHILRKGERRYSFILATSICPDNSARMFRPAVF